MPARASRLSPAFAGPVGVIRRGPVGGAFAVEVEADAALIDREKSSRPALFVCPDGALPRILISLGPVGGPVAEVASSCIESSSDGESGLGGDSLEAGS